MALAAGCGGDAKTSAKATDFSGSSGEDAGSFCHDFGTNYAEISGVGVSSDDLGSAFTDIRPVLDRLDNEAPASIRDDVRAVTAYLREYGSILARYNFNLESVRTNGTAQDNQILDSGGPIASFQKVDAFARGNCPGITLPQESVSTLSGSADGSTIVRADDPGAGTTTSTTTTEVPPSAGPRTFVVDNAAVADTSKPVALTVHPGDRIEVHLVRDFYKYTCCDVGGDPGVVRTDSSSSDGNGSVDALFTVVATGHATLGGSADPGCLDSKPACGAPSHLTSVDVTSAA